MKTLNRLRLGARSKLYQRAFRRLIFVHQTPVVRLGSKSGGWFVPLEALRPEGVCYCAGLGEDGTFDIELARQHHCSVFTFDPTPRAVAYAERALKGIAQLTFVPVGLWSESKTMKFYAPRDSRHVSHSVANLQHTSTYFEAPCKAIREIMKDLGHQHIDILKLDIEGAEFEVLQSLQRDQIRPRALCVEFDQPASMIQMVRQVRCLARWGYDLVMIDGWNLTFLARK